MQRASLRTLRTFYQQLETPRFFTPSDGFGDFHQIVTIRHGKPAVERKDHYTREEASTFMRNYDLAGIESFDREVFFLEEDAVEKIFTSHLPRAYQTAEALFGDRFTIERSTRFAELEREVVRFPASWRLPLAFWQVTNRLVYFAGKRYKNIESFGEAQERIRKAADFLAAEARKEGASILVAHGLFNHFLWQQLKSKGWLWLQKPDRNYLGVGHFLLSK